MPITMSRAEYDALVTAGLEGNTAEIERLRDLIDAVIVVDQVLANFYGGVPQSLTLGMVIDGEILRRLAGIWLVVAHLVAGVSKLFDYNLRDLLVRVPQHAHLPGSGNTVQDRRKTVN